MEHIVFAILALIRGLDNQFQKPLTRLIPDLDEFLADPAAYFGHSEVTIHPWRRWIGAVAFGLFFLFVFQLFSCFLLLDTFGNANPGGPAAWLTIIADLLLWLLAFSVGFLFGKWLLRGGSCTLNAAGVRFVRGNTEVFAPWTLFSTQGQPVVHPGEGRDRLDLPVNPRAVALVESRDLDLLTAQGVDVKTPQVWLSSSQEMRLRNYYQANLHDIGWLLLTVGRTITAQNPENQTLISDSVEEAELVPLFLTREKGNWISISLTRFYLPPKCCDCLNPTSNVKSYWAAGRLEGERVELPIPLCTECQWQFRNRFAMTIIKSCVIAVISCFAIGFVIGAAIDVLQKPNLFPAMAIVSALGGGLSSFLFLWLLRGWITRFAHPPVEVGRYSSKNGTVRLRFRQPEYASLVVEDMETID